MKVSLIIPGYNNLRHLKNAYESVRKHYKNIELILIDDGSYFYSFFIVKPQITLGHCV